MDHFIATYGYLAVFVLMLAESACVPVPSELVMPLGGALAAGAVAGAHLSLPLVIAAGVAGNVAGSYLAWAIGRYAGRGAARRWGGKVWLRDRDIERASGWFGRHGPKAVLIGRLLPVVRTFISLPAGFAGMAPVRFGIYTAIGCLLWSAALAVAGYAVGANWRRIDRRPGRRLRGGRRGRGRPGRRGLAVRPPPGGRRRAAGTVGPAPFCSRSIWRSTPAS